ncbi:disease resistance protein RUN1-like isoform X1 [Juglans regia]|uniref:ADP-ribosyl cyclase/cyclic ADP-ribose hydrolase n=1 Tax=Juglans regia TaxID=51240 RepID=A0A6P9ERI6_JUGRE|nr:disease resistance protein RUN1-like isoform X1 [Juglans regia]
MSSSSMAFQSGATSSSSSPSIHPWNHDVFLSFRGEDVRRNFISHLYQALLQRGINTYIDNNLERGEEISLALFKTIEGSMISIIVFSKNYAESRWCLDELLKILDCKETMKQIVLPIFYDVDPSDVRHQKGIFGKSFDKLGDKLKDNAKMLKWKVALQRVADLSGFPLAKFRDESTFIQEIIQWVDIRIVNQTPFSVACHPVGIESRIRDIYDQHLNIEMNDIIRVVGIFGTGGIGKTTISNYIYNRISSQFEGSCFLKDVRETSKRKGGLLELQNRLLSKILGTKSNIDDEDRGINVIRHRLSSKRVLLILDDVDELVQIEKLAGDRDWFGSGSRILITTRDQHLLEVFEVDSKYKVKILDENEALRLFSLHAFKKDEPLEGYVELSKQVTKYAQGLPLALKVLGSDLKGQSIDEWKNALDKYRKIPNDDIQKVLLVSYEGLHATEKQIFLDIAFFFKGEPLANVMKIFDCCGFSPVHGIKRLIDKCLITIEEHYNKCVKMHELLQVMGREIVRLKSPEEPSKRSRLWFHEDIREVLEESTGPNKIEGIVLDLPKGEEEMISLHPEAFQHMKRLGIFINRNACFSCAPNYLSEKLRVLDWSRYPGESLPHNFQGKKLIFFSMHASLIKELGDGFKPKNLTTMTLYDCNFLEKIPDLSSISNLKKLSVMCCTRLVEVHDSVGSLENLSLLNFYGCSKLQILPRSLNLRSLLQLCFDGCSSLRYLPKIECKMECLRKLSLNGTAIEELPLSIANLVGLEVLSLSNCKNLLRLPNIVCNLLQHLEFFSIAGCSNLVNKMGNDGPSHLAIESTKMKEEISLCEEPLHELAPPTNSSNWSTTLQESNLQISCSHSESKFFPISSLFTMFNSSVSLKSLDLSKIGIVSLPTSIKEFVALIQLHLHYCEKLEEIIELPPNIRHVNVEGCKSLERFSEVSKILEFNRSHIRSLQRIYLSGCDKMHVNIWNDKVQNPLLWKGVYEYDATLFPENQIPEWLSYVHEFLKDNDDGRRRGAKEEWVIDIEGPHYLEEISGIVLYGVIFFTAKFFVHGGIDRAKITSNSSNYACYIPEGVHLINTNSDRPMENKPAYTIWVGYSNLQSFGVKVLDNLRVQFDLRHHSDGMVPFYKSCRAKVVYKNERRANKKRKLEEETTKLCMESETHAHERLNQSSECVE